MGGRLHQEKLPSGHLIDVGPNWIHGTHENPIFDLAKRTNTAVGSWDRGAYVYNETGELLPEPDGDKYSTVMWDIIQEAFCYSNKNASVIGPKESLWDFFQREVVTRIPDGTPDFGEKRKIVLQMAEHWGAFIGTPVFRQSLKFFWLEECIDGGMYQRRIPESKQK